MPFEKYTKIPSCIEATQIKETDFTGDHPNDDHVIGVIYRPVERVVEVLTIEGVMTGGVNDWIIRGIEGELYVCKDSVFKKLHNKGDHAHDLFQGVIDQVADFHRRHGFDMGLPFNGSNPELDSYEAQIATGQVHSVARIMAATAAQWENGTISETINADFDTSNPFLMRFHLILEELAETMMAATNMDEVEFLDGLADLIYVIAGTAVAFDLPLAEAVEEVHRSNMTKEVGAGGDKDVRCRKKGESYEPPNIAGILAAHRGV